MPGAGQELSFVNDRYPPVQPAVAGPPLRRDVERIDRRTAGRSLSPDRPTNRASSPRRHHVMGNRGTLTLQPHTLQIDGASDGDFMFPSSLQRGDFRLLSSN